MFGIVFWVDEDILEYIWNYFWSLLERGDLGDIFNDIFSDIF